MDGGYELGDAHIDRLSYSLESHHKLAQKLRQIEKEIISQRNKRISML